MKTSRDEVVDIFNHSAASFILGAIVFFGIFNIFGDPIYLFLYMIVSLFALLLQFIPLFIVGKVKSYVIFDSVFWGIITGCIIYLVFILLTV